MGLIERLKDAVHEYLIYPSIALIPGRYQPKVFEKLLGASCIKGVLGDYQMQFDAQASSGKEVLTPENLEYIVGFENALKYSSRSGVLEFICSMGLFLGNGIYIAATGSGLDSNVIGYISFVSAVDGVYRLAISTGYQQRPVGLGEGILGLVATIVQSVRDFPAAIKDAIKPYKE